MKVEWKQGQKKRQLMGRKRRGKIKEDRGRRELLGSKEIMEEKRGMKMKTQKLGGKNRKTGRAQG